MTDPKIIVALDYQTSDEALEFVKKVTPEKCRLKVGNELFTAAGPELVRTLCEKGFGVFLDLKFHDIPNTVAQACRSAARLGVWLMNVHASGGEVMMRAAAAALAEFPSRPLLIGVTVLTSMDEAQLAGIGMEVSPLDQVKRLAALASRSGLDGVVCSAREVQAVKAAAGKDFLCVTPGIRPQWAAAGDQKRIMTPEAAIKEGSDYLVIGRPVTRADDPLKALEMIETEISAAQK
ncbi:MAG: orotidine-5'-phosphate decarboxylase [Succinivibrio sp.]|jgi:orotidine-5'-phosphate decarboxylase|nr:orotidine-5'-phosphate decarboxylase [Succinivibrio sp.]